MDVAWASRPKPGEHACGDEVLVVEDEERVLVAVVDGLGHGPKAAKAATAATDFVREHADLALIDMFRRCDRIIASTRGVAMTVVRIRKSDLQMQHAGVGNVEVNSLAQERVRPIPRPGVVGGRFRRVNQTQFQLHAADRIILFTDGISSRFDVGCYGRLTAQAAADAILKDCAKDHDDATCAVVVC